MCDIKKDTTNLWKELSVKYNLYKSEKLAILFEQNLTYSYLQDFVDFYKNIDKYFCLTVINKSDNIYFAKKDIDKCLTKRNIKDNYKKYIINYIDCNFYPINNQHEFDGEDVYLMLFANSEKEIIKTLEKFNRLKSFI